MAESNVSKFVRCTDPADPQRCQSVGLNFQCPFKAVPGSTHCPRHGGMKVVYKAVKEEMRLYTAAKWKAAIGNQADHPRLKSLKEEVGILRMMLNERLAQCQDNTDLMLASNSIAEMVTKIEHLVSSCNRLDEKLGSLLDKSQALQLAQEMITIISNYIDDSEILAALSEDLIGLVRGFAGSQEN